jgi:hypothetical protein
MKFDRIVGLGDSWMFGDELVDPALGNIYAVEPSNTEYREKHCFLGLLGQHYNVPVSNLGFPGGSLQSCIYNYIWWTENQTLTPTTLFLVGLPDASRMSWFDPHRVKTADDQPFNNYQHSIWLRNPSKKNYNASRNEKIDDWVTLSMLYDTLTCCPDAYRFKFKQAVLFFQGQSHAHPVIQFNVLPPPCVFDSPTLLWPDACVAGMLTADDLKPRKHPNENGHKKLANHLISQLDML